MRIHYLRLKKWLLAMAAAALGINVSCEMPCEYGTPEATYHVKGTITSPDGTPVQGIKVSQYWISSTSYHTSLDTTNIQGDFDITFRQILLDSIRLAFSDIDSTQNGLFRDTSIAIPALHIHLTGGDGHWYAGEGSVNVNITLTPKIK